MRRSFVLFSFLACIAACNSSGSSSNNTKDSSNAKTETSASTDPQVEKGLNLVAKSDCFTCHKVDEASTGPAYTAVAERYAGKEGAVDTLAQKIIKGGAGNWGAVPMIGHPSISEEDAKSMVHYVLSLKK
ncbi:MAG TPA: c-type cytochrome [Flavisolibacter sp.]|nr:c-type cytochrome [Flavisolibacter sp.]